jgi:hypothetical protein
MSAITAQQAQPVGLNQKLLLIRRGMKTIRKLGWNDHHKYKYVRAEDAVGKAQRLLDKYDVLLTPEVDHERELVFQGTTVLVPMLYTFEDVESGETKTVRWLGAGQDKGDKGVYKSYTGSTKFFLIQFFQVQVGDAPEPEATDENGQGTSRPAQAPSTVANDAERPAATRVPLDRAKAILVSAKAADLVNEDDSFTAVFKAKLADVGVQKIGQLDVDQAEAVEAFIAEEARAAKLQTEAAEKASA